MMAFTKGINTFGVANYIVAIVICLKSISAQIDPPNYYCDLQWVPEGFGNVPRYAISPGPGEYVAKVNLAENLEWRLGRLIPKEGKALFVFLAQSGDHTVLESDTYEVLTNPDNCVLKWLENFGGDVPVYAVAAEEDKLEFVARSTVAGFMMAGSLVPSESALLIPYEGRVYTQRRYEVLTSKYPQLNMKLTDFDFPILDFRVLELKSRKTLIGQMEVVTQAEPIQNMNVEVTQPISHNKVIKEVFQFVEKFGWEGVANISIEMDLWVGSPTIETSFSTVHSNTELIYKRNRDIHIDRVIRTTTAAGMSGPSPSVPMQICSVVTVLQEYHGVKFEALAQVSSAGMRADQVKEILIRTGRNLLDQLDVDERDGSVVARIYGTLKGKFALSSASIYSSLDSHGACNSVLTK